VVKKKNNLDFIVEKLKKCVGDIKLIEHTNGVSFGGIHEINLKTQTVTIINEIGLEKINQSEKDKLSTTNIYSDKSCVDIIDLNTILKIK